MRRDAHVRNVWVAMACDGRSARLLARAKPISPARRRCLGRNRGAALSYFKSRRVAPTYKRARSAPQPIRTRRRYKTLSCRGRSNARNFGSSLAFQTGGPGVENAEAANNCPCRSPQCCANHRCGLPVATNSKSRFFSSGVHFLLLFFGMARFTSSQCVTYHRVRVARCLQFQEPLVFVWRPQFLRSFDMFATIEWVSAINSSAARSDCS